MNLLQEFAVFGSKIVNGIKSQAEIEIDSKNELLSEWARLFPKGK